MRSPKIIAAAVEELNKLLDQHPEALQELLQYQVPTAPHVGAPTLSALDVVNAVLRAVADGKEVATSWSGNAPHSTSVLCGFTERRVRRVPPSVEVAPNPASE